MGGFAILGVCLIVFIETGLLVGFFLPGDSLLFITGLLTVIGFSTHDTIVVFDRIREHLAHNEKTNTNKASKPASRHFCQINSYLSPTTSMPLGTLKTKARGSILGLTLT